MAQDRVGDEAEHGEPEPEITGTWLRHLILSKKVLTEDYNVPSPLRLKPVAELVERCRVLATFDERGLRADDVPVRKAMEAIGLLAEVLPGIKARFDAGTAKMMELDVLEDFPMLQVYVDDAAQIGTLMDAVLAAKDNGLLRPMFESVPVIRRWTDFAVEVGEAFRAAVASCNPGREIGIANTGPVAKFLAAITPYITGEQLKAETFGRSTRRKREKGGKLH